MGPTLDNLWAPRNGSGRGWIGIVRRERQKVKIMVGGGGGGGGRYGELAKVCSKEGVKVFLLRRGHHFRLLVSFLGP